MTIRRAGPEDAEHICRVHVRSIRTLCAADYTIEQIEAWAGKKKLQKYREAMTQGGETMFVAADDCRRIVGFVAFKGAEIYGLYVDPESIGQGAGTALLAAAEAEMRAGGVVEAKFRSTTTALTFYLARGYTRGEDAIFRMGEVGIPCVWVSKTL